MWCGCGANYHKGVLPVAHGQIHLLAILYIYSIEVKLWQNKDNKCTNTITPTEIFPVL